MQEKLLGFSDEWKSLICGRVKGSDPSTQSRGVMSVLYGPGENPFPSFPTSLGCIAAVEASFGYL